MVTAVDNLCLDVKIGVSDDERLQPRQVRIFFKIYQENWEACKDDENGRYICYSAISESIKNYCHSKEFKLIEYLCYQLYLLIKSQVYDNKVYVRLEKSHIQCHDMIFDASAEYSDV